MISVIVALCFPQVLVAQTTTGDFLRWERAEQDSFLEVSLTMLLTVVTQVAPQSSHVLVIGTLHPKLTNQACMMKFLKPCSLIRSLPRRHSSLAMRKVFAVNLTNRLSAYLYRRHDGMVTARYAR